MAAPKPIEGFTRVPGPTHYKGGWVRHDACGKVIRNTGLGIGSHRRSCTVKRDAMIAEMDKRDAMPDHEPVPRPGTRVDRSTIQRPLAGEEAICDVCGGRITTWPVNPGWRHR